MKTKALLVLGSAAQVIGALLAIVDQLSPSLALLSTPKALVIIGVATAIRSVIYTAGDLADDGVKNDSFKP